MTNLTGVDAMTDFVRLGWDKNLCYVLSEILSHTINKNDK